MNINRLFTRFRILAAMLALAFFVPAARAAEALLLQDTYVDNGTTGKPAPNATNNGSAADLRIFKGSGRIGRTFIKFSLATLPPDTNPSDVTQARLRLWVNSNSTVLGSITLTPITSHWDELALTDKSSSTVAFGSPKVADLPVSYTNNFISIDVTEWVQAWLNGTLPNEGFVIEASASTTTLNLAFDSKESTLTSHEPRLEVSLSRVGPAGPAGAQGPQGIQGLAGLPGPSGATGPAGPAGPIGPAGVQGVAGPVGLTGAQGAKGDTGSQGPEGPQGIAGLNGTKWYSSSGSPSQSVGSQDDYYIDTDSGDVWQKTVAENGPTWIRQANLRGPQGPAGPQGATGANGEAGAAGASGPQGPVGPIGLSGANGAPGPVGPEGPPGPAGAAAAPVTRIAPQGDLSMGEFTQGPTP